MEKDNWQMIVRKQKQMSEPQYLDGDKAARSLHACSQCDLVECDCTPDDSGTPDRMREDEE